MMLDFREKPIIALITDYGLRDTYVAQVKAVILSYRRDVVLVDVTHEVEPFNEVEAAFLITTYVPYMPPGTIHVCVIDPGVGGTRKPIIIHTVKGDIFIGPDTGLMIPAAERLGIINVYEIDESRFPRRFSETFHGRDIFAHAAGKLITGASLDEIGKQLLEYNRLTLPKPVKIGEYIEATILHVDRFGNIITNLKPEDLNIEFGELVEISTPSSNVITCRFVESYSRVGVGDYLATIGGSGYIELSINRGNAAERLRIKSGDKLRVRLVENI